LTFLWTCRVRVGQAIQQAEVGQHTAVDYYSLCREVAEVIMSHEVKDRPLGGPGQGCTF